LNLVIRKEQVVLNVGAAPTGSLSNGNLDFPDKQLIEKPAVDSFVIPFKNGIEPQPNHTKDVTCGQE